MSLAAERLGVAPVPRSLSKLGVADVVFRDLIAAIALAYEIDCRLLDAAEVTGRGWDHPVYSLPASALAAGRLMRLSAEVLTQAVNLAINGHIAMNQTRVQTLSDWKGVADAEATRAGVFAARLARAGLYAVLSVTSDEALKAVALNVPPKTTLEIVGGLSRALVKRIRLKPGELRLV